MHRPDPITATNAHPVDRTTDAKRAAQGLRDGDTLLVTDTYSTGAEILHQLSRLLRAPPDSAPYAVRQAHRHGLREAQLRLIAPVNHHRVGLQDARPIPLLQELYPREHRFWLPFIQIQELHGAWGRFVEGTHMAVLGHKVHPWFGTYAPTRTTHLELFATWLSQYEGARTQAIDVGTGCGVLAFMLCKAGFKRVLATDDNPNAIESVRRELKALGPRALSLRVTDLLGEDLTPVDLVVFNPPWLMGEVDGLLDRALFYDDPAMFKRFFDQASARLAPNGRVVVIFSNLTTLVQPDLDHPLEIELARGRFELVQKLHRKVKPTPDSQGRRRKTREKVEVWELRKTP